MEEATGAPSSFAVSDPKRLRASGRDGETVMTEPPSPLRMLLARHTKRREFMALLGGAAAAWPLAARAQQRERVRQIGVLMAGANSDLDEQFRLTAFQNGLRGLGWAQGHNIQIDIRKTAGNAERFRPYAVELVAAKPDVLMADTSPSTAALQRET